MKASLSWELVRRAITALLLLSSCGRETPREAPDEREEAGPAPSEDPEAVRKRECVAQLTAEAEPQVHALLRSLCAEWVELRVPGLAFAWVRPDKPAVHAELGVRCNGEEQPVEASSAFRIGSVSKPITAALALGLIA
ncbi:MAG TPA: serine hydrolase, partial [Enhygromyxa sp.]|nr:serine hydrolase [Enhygromyxa sp.]